MELFRIIFIYGIPGGDIKKNRKVYSINMNINGMLRGNDVYILGGGTSLKGFDFSRLQNKIVIAVNHSIESYKQSEFLIFGDKIFVTTSRPKFDLLKYNGLIFASEKTTGTEPVTTMKNAGNKNLIIFRDRRDEPQLNIKAGLYHPTSSGMMAINLALIMQARKIYLLGYDYYYDNGNIHFYADYPHHKRVEEKKFEHKLPKFAKFEKYSKNIYNFNQLSNVKEFQKIPMDGVL